jgi:hypothetical protein
MQMQSYEMAYEMAREQEWTSLPSSLKKLYFGESVFI